VRRILGVNLRDTELKASLTDFRLRTSRHVKSEDVDLPGGISDGGKIVSNFFKKWKEEYSPRGVVLGLSSKNFSHQVVEIPPMKRSDLKRALSFELEKHLPLPVDEYLFDFIPMRGDGGENKVLVFSIKKDVIHQLIKYAREAELNVLSVRLSTVTALCSFLKSSGVRKINGLFVRMIDDAYEVFGLKNSLPVFFKKFSRDIDMSYEIEQLLVTQPGIVYFDGNQELALMEKFNSRKFPISVTDALALLEVKKSGLNLNFLPDEYIAQKKDYYPHVLGGFAAAAVIIFVLTGVIAYMKDLNTLKSIEAQIASIESEAAAVVEARKLLQFVRNDRKILVDFQNSSNISVKVMSDLSRLLPRDAWLINLQVDDKGRIEIEGFVAKSSALVVELEESEAFKNVSFSSPIIARGGEERFSIEMEAEDIGTQ
jgi:hypothetical protein